MQGPCEHCGNPDKSKFTTQCKYKGDWPSRRAFVLSTFDPLALIWFAFKKF